MLQTLTNTRPYAQPRAPLEVDGESFALPPDLLTGLNFLRRFTRPKGQTIERTVHACGRRLDVLTNNIAIDYEIGSCDLPAMCLAPSTIRLLDAFGAPPAYLEVEKSSPDPNALFLWENGQQLYFSRDFLGERTPSSCARLALMERFWQKGGDAIDEEARRAVLKSHKGFGPDIYVNRDAAISRRSRNGKTWSIETASEFPIEVERPMRFDLDSFLLVIGVADEINFSTSPVSFNHANGRGLLIERTLGADVPDGEYADD